MVCFQLLKWRSLMRYRFAIFALIFLITATEGRKLVQSADFSKTLKEEKFIMRGQIGSRPPRCDRRCSTCEHCEAIQVPTNPQIKNGKNNRSSKEIVSAENYGRSDQDTSNYKPMSWKCKCGNLIFNP